MGRLSQRETRFAGIYRVILAAYWLTCAGLMAFWLARGDWYQFFQSAANACMPGLFLLVWRALRLGRTYQLEAVILAFTFLAYTLGVGACWYHLIPHYDKLMHCLSGAFTMYLALPCFYWLKAEKSFKPTDCALAAAFCLLYSSLFGIPVSTTHTKTSAIMGVGAVRRLSSINLGVVREMVLTWIFTFPGCGLISFVMAKLFLFLF